MQEDIKLEAVHYYWVERVNRAAKDLTKQVFLREDIPLTVEQWVLMKRIAEEPGINQKTLSDQTYKEPAAVTRTLTLLVNKGYLAKTASERDRRHYHLALTEAGESLYAKALPMVQAMRAEGLKGLNESEQVQLITLLRRMHENLEKAI